MHTHTHTHTHNTHTPVNYMPQENIKLNKNSKNFSKQCLLKSTMRSMCSPWFKQYLPDHLYLTQEVLQEIFPQVASKYHGDMLII